MSEKPSFESSLSKNKTLEQKNKNLEQKLKQEQQKRKQEDLRNRLKSAKLGEKLAKAQEQGLASSLLEQLGSGKIMETSYKGVKNVAKETYNKGKETVVTAADYTAKLAKLSGDKFVKGIEYAVQKGIAPVGKLVALGAAHGIEGVIAVYKGCDTYLSKVPAEFWTATSKQFNVYAKKEMAKAIIRLDRDVVIPVAWFKEVSKTWTIDFAKGCFKTMVEGGVLSVKFVNGAARLAYKKTGQIIPGLESINTAIMNEGDWAQKKQEKKR